METENASEVEDRDKSVRNINGKDLYGDKSDKIKVCFGDIDQSEDFVSDLNAEVDLDDSVNVDVADNEKEITEDCKDVIASDPSVDVIASDISVDVLATDKGSTMDAYDLTDEGQKNANSENHENEQDKEEKHCSETPELNENAKNEKDAISEENKLNGSENNQTPSECENISCLADEISEKQVDDKGGESKLLDSDVNNIEMGNNLNGNGSDKEEGEELNAETGSNEKNTTNHESPQNDKNDVTNETMNTEDKTKAEEEVRSTDNGTESFELKEGESVSEVDGRDEGTDVDQVGIVDTTPDIEGTAKEGEEVVTMDTNLEVNETQQDESRETKDNIDDTKVESEHDEQIQNEENKEITDDDNVNILQTNTATDSKENENIVSVESMALIESSMENVEIDPDALDKEGIQQFLKAVIDDLQGIVIETEACDTVVDEINAKNETSNVENNILGTKLEEGVMCKTPEPNDECITGKEASEDLQKVELVIQNSECVVKETNDEIEKVELIINNNDGIVKETEEKIEKLELIIDNNDSDDTELINDVKECELLIEERSDETVQSENSSEVETKDVMDDNSAQEAENRSTTENSNISAEQNDDKCQDKASVLGFKGDTANETGDSSNDKVANREDVVELSEETSMRHVSVYQDLVPCEEMDYKCVSASTESVGSVKQDTTVKMVSNEGQLQEVRSALRVSQQLLQDERSKHNREVMSLKLQLCRSQMQLKCQRSRSEKQMTDIMAQLVVLESRLRQEQKNLKKELRGRTYTIACQKQEIMKLKDQNEQLLNAIKEICAKGGMNGYMRENRRKNGSNAEIVNNGKGGKDKKGNNSGKLGSVKDKFLSKNRSSLELNSFNLERYLLKDDRLCSSQEDLRKITEDRRRSIPNVDSSLNGGERFDMSPRDRPHSDSTEYKNNNRKHGRYNQNFFTEAGSPQYEINKSISESSHLSENSNSSSGVYSLSDHDLSMNPHDVSVTNGNHSNVSNDFNDEDEDDDRIFSFSSTHINTVIDEEDIMGPMSHTGPMMSMGSMPMLANLSEEQALRSGSGKHRPHSLSSVDLASIQLQAENLSSPGMKHPQSPLASEGGTPPGSPSYLQNKNELTPFQTFKTMFRRKGSSKNKGHKKRSVSLSQTSNKEYSEALKKHFQKYDMS